MLRICDFIEIEKNKIELIQTSGYCIINLICNNILETGVKLNDNHIIDFSFAEYDYEETNNRNSNEEYIKNAEKCVNNLGLRRNL